MAPSNSELYRTKAWKILSRAFQADKVANTYLLHGPDGTGRWLTTVAFAALLNCDSHEVIDNDIAIPCGSCRNCLNIFHLNFDSLKIIVPVPPHENKIDKAIDLTNEYIAMKRAEPYALLTSKKTTNIPISIVREIKKSLSMKSDPGIKRVVMFYKMEEMKHTSADALLKMIEEPPSDTLIMLISNKPEALLPTIQSRSQKILLEKNKPADIESYLLEHYELSPARAKTVSTICGGSKGKAISLLEQDDGNESGGRPVMFHIFKSLLLDKPVETLSLMNEMLSLRDKTEAEQLLQLWQLLIRDCSYYASTGQESDIINVDFLVDIKKLSPPFTHAGLTAQLLEYIKFTLADLPLNVHIQGSLMAMVLKMKLALKAA